MTSGFKKKTISKVIRSKIKDWIRSIDDESLAEAIKKDVICTGGSITSMLLGEEIKDFDLYFRTKETTIAVAKYYCDKFIKNTKSDLEPAVRVSDDGRVTIYFGGLACAKSEDAEDSYEEVYENSLAEGRADVVESDNPNKELGEDGKPKYRPMFLSENAITLSNKIQLVIRFYGEPEEIHKNYDYIHCQNVYDYNSDEVHLLPEALESILSKTLIYTGSLYPICSLFRMRKFLDRGWRISAGEIVKMSYQVSKLNLNDLSVLKEQLTGCDMLYMANLVKALEDWYDENEGKEMTPTYMMEMIDEVFNR